MSHYPIVILTGAGISAESGLATFRAQDGLWCEHRVEDVATPEAFERDPALVQRFYNMRRSQLKEVKPNAAHIALVDLAHRFTVKVLLVTQNVDDLHDRALSENPTANFKLLHMHGELNKVRCTESDKVFDWIEDVDPHTSKCPCCKQVGTLRPHIVWFGEMPLHMETIHRALQTCRLFISIGTSGNVYPAAGFVHEVKMYGKGKSVELNLEPSSGHSLFDEKRYGKATEIVPAFVEEVISGKYSVL